MTENPTMSTVRERMILARDWMREQGKRKSQPPAEGEPDWLDGLFVGQCLARADAARILHSILQDLDEVLGNEVEPDADW